MFVSGKYTCKNHAKPGISARIAEVRLPRRYDYRRLGIGSLGLRLVLGRGRAFWQQGAEKSAKKVLADPKGGVGCRR